jgi:copper chaperone CopZ
MHRLHVSVGGLRDADSVRALANAIQDLPSIGHVDISLEKGDATIEHGNFVSPEDIIQAIGEAGFTAEYSA